MTPTVQQYTLIRDAIKAGVASENDPEGPLTVAYQSKDLAYLRNWLNQPSDPDVQVWRTDVKLIQITNAARVTDLKSIGADGRDALRLLFGNDDPSLDATRQQVRDNLNDVFAGTPSADLVSAICSRSASRMEALDAPNQGGAGVTSFISISLDTGIGGEWYNTLYANDGSPL